MKAPGHYAANRLGDPLIEVDLLENKQLKAVHSSAKKVLTEKGERHTVALILVPLERLGAEQGKSGSRVMVAYFESRKPNKAGTLVLPPMVLKLSLPGKYSDLKREERKSIFIRKLAAKKERFAVPECCHKEDELGVLWSPFASKGALYVRGASGLQLGTLSFADRLRETARKASSLGPKEGEELVGVIDKVYPLLKPIYEKAKASKKGRSLLQEYKYYLRGIETDSWGARWRSAWPNTMHEVRYQGRSWINPLWVLRKLRRLQPKRLFCGVVHGDLHPRNIVFSEGVPCVIDFGWTEDHSHIAKDFVLLECNLRFMLLPADVPYADIVCLSKWIGLDAEQPRFAPSPAGGLSATDLAVTLIHALREWAKDVFPQKTDFDTEYIVPLFLVALGLLKHLRTADNQMSAILTVLSLGEYLHKKSTLAECLSSP